jgi:predicted TIM-barrel fold metal-dependent hydrolase
MILDCELYLLDFPIVGRIYDVPALENLMDEAGIDQAVLMPPVTIKPDNVWMIEQIKGNSRFIPCILLNPQFGNESINELEIAVNEWGVKGLKLMPTKHGFSIAKGQANALIAKCAELNIPVSIHSEGGYAHPLAISVTAEAFPDVPIIMDHMGYRYWAADAVEAAKRAPNIYLATTAVMEPFFIDQAIKALGVDRIVFGSNGPFVIPKMQIEVIRHLGLSQQEEAKIMGETLAKLYNIE